jgi:hypothetical protein
VGIATDRPAGERIQGSDCQTFEATPAKATRELADIPPVAGTAAGRAANGLRRTLGPATRQARAGARTPMRWLRGTPARDVAIRTHSGAGPVRTTIGRLADSDGRTMPVSARECQAMQDPVSQVAGWPVGRLAAGGRQIAQEDATECQAMPPPVLGVVDPFGFGCVYRRAMQSKSTDGTGSCERGSPFVGRTMAGPLQLRHGPSARKGSVTAKVRPTTAGIRWRIEAISGSSRKGLAGQALKPT